MTLGFLNARINKLWKWVLYLRANMGEGGGGNITSVNGDTGPDVVLTAEDVGALNSVETGDTPAIVLSGDGTSGDPLEANFASTASSNLNVEFVASNGALINGSVQAMSSEYGNTLQTKVSTIVAGDGVSVDDTDVKNPIISFTGGGVTSIQAGDNITVDNTDPANPIISSTGGGNQIEITEGDTTFPQGVLKLQQPIENTGYISISEDTAISLSDTASIHTINFIVGANSMTISADGTTTPMNISAAAATQPTHLVTLNQLNNSLSSKLTASQGVAVADAVDETDVVTQFNALLASLRTAGIIAT